MKRNNRQIHLSESQLNKIIENAIIETLNEGRFDNLKNKAAKAAMYAALIGGGTGLASVTIPMGIENQERYEQSINADAAKNGKDYEIEMLKDRGLSDEQIDDYIANGHFENGDDSISESRSIRMPIISESKIKRILRRNINRFARA